VTMRHRAYRSGCLYATACLGLLKQASLVAPGLLGASLGATTGALAAGEGNRIEGALLGSALGAAGGAGGAALGRRTGSGIRQWAEGVANKHLAAADAAELAGAVRPSTETLLTNLEHIRAAEPWIEHAGTAGGTAIGMGAAGRLAPGPAPQPNQDPYGYYQ